MEGPIELKSRAGRRKVPIVAILRDHLDEHMARSGRGGPDLIFGRTPETPFYGNRLQERADRAWEAANARERRAAEGGGDEPAALDRITPHGLRHGFAAMMIAAGVNAKALQTFMGHANISITLDRYGHLMPGSEAEAARLVESYLAAQGRARRRAGSRGEARGKNGGKRCKSWATRDDPRRPHNGLNKDTSPTEAIAR